ncbi:DDE superfamily endonuclease [Rhizoctonia solani]|uniref:DDE superfamily endonuclease n=1 Tax=Rhizoctonia solani TaxID=456999 RepID=A0A8H7LRL7_9AGAM|nr:DDE superfamily endonuclease [Rhizoctonia solani]
MPKTSKIDHESREACFQAAQQDFASGLYKSYAAAAQAHQVSPVTLSNRIKGKHTDARTAQQSKQKLSAPVERTLLDWCIFNGMIGMPWTIETLKSRAQAVANPDVKITMSWCRRFLHRYRKKLKYKYAYELDPKRASGFNCPTVETYFKMIIELMEDYNIPIEHIYNMDEKGLQIGGGRATSRRKHIFGFLQKAQYKLKHDCLELMTIIECICADGYAMKPTFVHQPGDVGFWWENKEIGCCVSTENGWTSDNVCKAWFTKVFLQTATQRQVSEAPIVLLLDGHGSHISTQILEAAFKNRVFIICLPPKTTHKLQPLDVGVFNLVQGDWKKRCKDSAGAGVPINKVAAISRYMEARKAGLHSAAVKDAWRRSGQYPLNPNIFGDEDYAPSKVSSTLVHLPPSFPALATPVVEWPITPTQPDQGTPDAVHNPLLIEDPSAAQATHEAVRVGSTKDLHLRHPVRAEYIHDRRGDSLKQQARGYRDDAEAVWELARGLWDQLESTKAHAALLQAENGVLRQQIQARTKPKRTQDEATAALFVQKHGFMTNPESEAAFEARLGELREKRAAEEQKEAEKEARTRELEGKRSCMIADPDYAFTGTIQSYKVANLEQIGDLAASLALPFVGLKKADIFNNIINHFEAHSELKSLPRYSNLFRATRRRRNDPAASHDTVNRVPAIVAEPALPPQP